ncbi:PilW family protein [Acinetobacter albensis]|nr:PilW family protein [Acinetobacter albensis]
MVVQRYFLRTDNNKASNEDSPLALACDAGYYALNTPNTIVGYGGSGEIIMKRVDYFRVLLGVQFANGTHRYLPIDSYLALTAPRPRILSIQLGALVRSTQSVGAESAVKADQQFQVLGQTVKLKTSTDPKYIRQVVSQTVALRNALGERE